MACMATAASGIDLDPLLLRTWMLLAFPKRRIQSVEASAHSKASAWALADNLKPPAKDRIEKQRKIENFATKKEDINWCKVFNTELHSSAWNMSRSVVPGGAWKTHCIPQNFRRTRCVQSPNWSTAQFNTIKNQQLKEVYCFFLLLLYLHFRSDAGTCKMAMLCLI